MSRAQLSKPGFSAKSVLTITLIATSSVSYAAESIDQPVTRISINRFRRAIKKDDRSTFETLPVEGYKNELIGLLIRTNTYTNPEYSSTDCDMDIVIISVQERKTLPGCRASLKLATKDSDGSYHDGGIRIEYSITTGSRKFIASNSAWVQYAIGGDEVLELSLR